MTLPMPHFEPTRAAAQHALAAVRPEAYAGSRNHLNGAVTQLSPYFTHGLLSQREAFDFLHHRAPLHPQHKLVYEFGWRAYFRHVWSHLGEGILSSLHPGPLPDLAYHPEVPGDVRQARSGVPVIDRAVQMLYTTGHLHNHARMWLASYLVHVRKVSWRAGADWLYGHLLDGDLASNHLSWQWVAGTGSAKPYLFNAENVARYAPAQWHSPGSVIDTSYDALDHMARCAANDAAPARSTHHSGVPEPDFVAPPTSTTHLPGWRGKPVLLQHPWALGPRPAEVPDDVMVLGLVLTDFHHRHPWSARRWDFVATAWRHQGTPVWACEAANLFSALAEATSVWVVDDPHLGPWRPQFPPNTHWCQMPALFAEVPTRCDSFSRWWQRTRVLGAEA